MTEETASINIGGKPLLPFFNPVRGSGDLDPPDLSTVQARTGKQNGVTKSGKAVTIALSALAASSLANARQRGIEVEAKSWDRETRDAVPLLIIDDITPVGSIAPVATRQSLTHDQRRAYLTKLDAWARAAGSRALASSQALRKPLFPQSREITAKQRGEDLANIEASIQRANRR